AARSTRSGPARARGRPSTPSVRPGDAAGEHSKTRARTRGRGAHARACDRLAGGPVRELQRGTGRLQRRPATLELRALGQNTLADVDDRRVELRRGAFVETPQRLFAWKPLSVGPIRRHRVVRVTDQDDPRLDRNVLALPAVGIAGAVIALVAMPHDGPDFLETVDRRNDPLAELGMLLDELALLVRQGPRLGE